MLKNNFSFDNVLEFINLLNECLSNIPKFFKLLKYKQNFNFYEFF
jgi:hypothetical protein